jgi:hypothetical protein
MQGLKNEFRNLDGIFRGIVVDNTGELGRCKIYIPTIYPPEFEENFDSLPWAEPAMSLMGGNFTGKGGQNIETGFAGWPKVGAIVWLFFERQSYGNPVYFAASQAGPGWISEHNEQWNYQSDNVRIRIDEAPENGSCKFDTYNKECTSQSKPLAKEEVPTRLDIEVTGNVNLKITGNINIQINGDVYEEINGNKHETLNGNLYRRHVGDIHYEHEGSSIIEREGDVLYKVEGSKKTIRDGDKDEFIIGNEYKKVSKTKTLQVDDQYTEILQSGRGSTIRGLDSKTVIGENKEYIDGPASETVSGSKSIKVGSSTTLKSGGNVSIKGSTINLN